MKDTMRCYDVLLHLTYRIILILLCLSFKAGCTPLHYAAKNGHAGVITLLLDRGAHVEEKNEVSSILECTFESIFE
jgi:ankyrin repeat protein